MTLQFINTYAQNSPFQGTWKWEHNNQTFYVFIKSETINNNNKVLSLDYKLVDINNSDIYNSKINNEFFWAGAILNEVNYYGSGFISDCTHNQTDDCFDGWINLKYISPSGGLGSQPTLHWKLKKFSDYMQGSTTINPPDNFNLPTDIILTKVQ